MTEINYEGIDVLIRPIIRILNDNGIVTRFSCQGHGDKDRLYIMFDSGIKEEELVFLLDLFDRNFDSELPLGVTVKLYYWIRDTSFRKLGRLKNWMFEVNIFEESSRAQIISKMENRLREHFEMQFK